MVINANAVLAKSTKNVTLYMVVYPLTLSNENQYMYFVCCVLVQHCRTHIWTFSDMNVGSMYCVLHCQMGTLYHTFFKQMWQGNSSISYQTCWGTI